MANPAKPVAYTRVTYEHRCQISALKKSGLSHRKIAAQLGVHASTIDREVKRNTGGRGYRHVQAQRLCEERRQARRGMPLKMTQDMIGFIEEKLVSSQWSPEQISGWMRAHRPAGWVSHERIYQHILADKRRGGSLYMHLRRKTRRYQKRINGKTRRGQITGRVDISERPPVVETRARTGDWEADTVIGLGHQTALVTLVERKSRYTRIVRIPANTAQNASAAIIAALTPCKALVHTITFDNGKEFAFHRDIAQSLETQTFFAKPYHSWQRATNENTNGLIRQYFPKKTNFATISDEQVETVERLLNARPRKCLGYRSPAEVFAEAV